MYHLIVALREFLYSRPILESVARVLITQQPSFLNQIFRVNLQTRSSLSIHPLIPTGRFLTTQATTILQFIMQLLPQLIRNFKRRHARLLLRASIILLLIRQEIFHFGTRPQKRLLVYTLLSRMSFLLCLYLLLQLIQDDHPAGFRIILCSNGFSFAYLILGMA